MSDSNKARQVATNVARALRKNPPVRAVWLVGAAQRNKLWADSDVDMLVLLDDAPLVPESYAERSDQSVHLHWIGSAQLQQALSPTGQPRLHGWLADGELLFDRDGEMAALGERLREFPADYRLAHLLPHLEAIVGWARDLRKRMALHDERPRRAAARQWEVDQHSAAVLLIEKGRYPHNEPTTQALEARIFVPNLADPDELEGFVLPRIEQPLLPALRDWVGSDPFDAATLQQDVGICAIPRLLELAARQGWLRRVRNSERSPLAFQELLYRIA